MKYFLAILGGLLWLGALANYVTATNAMGQVAATVQGVSGSVLVAAAIIVRAIGNLPQRSDTKEAYIKGPGD